MKKCSYAENQNTFIFYGDGILLQGKAIQQCAHKGTTSVRTRLRGKEAPLPLTIHGGGDIWENAPPFLPPNQMLMNARHYSNNSAGGDRNKLDVFSIVPFQPKTETTVVEAIYMGLDPTKDSSSSTFACLLP